MSRTGRQCFAGHQQWSAVWLGEPVWLPAAAEELPASLLTAPGLAGHVPAFPSVLEDELFSHPART